MSIWSAIGLADRKAIEKLTEQIEALRQENSALIAENQRLVLAQLSERFISLYDVENQGVRLISDKIQEEHKKTFLEIESMSQLFLNQLTASSEQTGEGISAAKQQIEGDISVVRESLNKLMKKHEEAQSKMNDRYAEIEEATGRLEQTVLTDGDLSRKNAAQLKAQLEEQLATVIQNQKTEEKTAESSFKELTEASLSQSNEIKALLSSSHKQLLDEQRQLADDNSRRITESSKELARGIERYCASALEEVKKTAERYSQIGNDSQETLNKMQALSNEMLELGERQRTVMEHLSQLSQDADQFMEIQKSLNDIWEIMKAVWVDSLLNDYQKKLGR